MDALSQPQVRTIILGANTVARSSGRVYGQVTGQGGQIIADSETPTAA